MTRRRWIATEFDEETATLSGDQANHLIRVLRAEPGMRADVVAGERVFQAVIEHVAEASVRFRLEQEVARDDSLPVELLLAIFKFDRMEWAIEKAVELGAGTIVPVIARRTEKHLAQAATARVDRWRRIALEAAKQSRSSSVPEIAAPCHLSEALATRRSADRLRIVLSEHEKTMTLTRCIANVKPGQEKLSLATGPEGGWSSEEVALFSESGWTAASLGPRILRAETAAIASLALVSGLLGKPSFR